MQVRNSESRRTQRSGHNSRGKHDGSISGAGVGVTDRRGAISGDVVVCWKVTPRLVAAVMVMVKVQKLLHHISPQTSH